MCVYGCVRMCMYPDLVGDVADGDDRVSGQQVVLSHRLPQSHRAQRVQVTQNHLPLRTNAHINIQKNHYINMCSKNIDVFKEIVYYSTYWLLRTTSLSHCDTHVQTQVS